MILFDLLSKQHLSLDNIKGLHCCQISAVVNRFSSIFTFRAVITLSSVSLPRNWSANEN